MTTSLTPQAPSATTTSPIPPQPGRPAREATTFVGLVTVMVLGVAFAFPHANIAQLFSMVTPLVALGLITLFWTPRGQRKQLWASVGLQRLGLRSWPAALLLSAAIVFVIPYATADLLGSLAVKPLGTSLDGWVNGAARVAIDLLVASAFAFTEEIGWRGYLLPRIQTLTSKRRAALVVGFIHGLFHVPLMVFTTTYNNVGNRWIVVPTVVATLTAAGVFYAWLKDRSGSVWPVAIAHGSVNALIDGTVYVVVLSPVAFAYTATESGLATLAAAAAIAGFLLVRGHTWSARTPQA